jgi:hypothetical protein
VGVSSSDIHIHITSPEDGEYFGGDIAVVGQVLVSNADEQNVCKPSDRTAGETCTTFIQLQVNGTMRSCKILTPALHGTSLTFKFVEPALPFGEHTITVAVRSGGCSEQLGDAAHSDLSDETLAADTVRVHALGPYSMRILSPGRREVVIGKALRIVVGLRGKTILPGCVPASFPNWRTHHKHRD